MDLLTALVTYAGFQLTVGGAMGGVARWILLQPKEWSDRIGTVVLGAILGFYVSPQLEPSFHSWLTDGVFFGVHFVIDDEKLPGFTAFATGVGGIALLGFGLDWFTLLRKRKTESDNDVAAPPKSPEGHP